VPPSFKIFFANGKSPKHDGFYSNCLLYLLDFLSNPFFHEVFFINVVLFGNGLVAEHTGSSVRACKGLRKN
jgi:hypothetical protein